MKILLDACVWGGARAALTVAGHDVIWVGEWPEDPGDATILMRAHSEERVLVTLDRDFGEIAVVRGVRHSGIVRLVNLPAREQAVFCDLALTLHEKDLVAGGIVTVEPGRIRVRPFD